MRFVIRAIYPTEAGNKMNKDPKFAESGELKANKVEQSYFMELNGDRTAVFILDMPSTDRIQS